MKNNTLNFVTVCTEAYPVDYARKLHTRIKQISEIQFKHYCITDRPEQVFDWAEPLPQFVEAYGWWNKVNLFSPQMPKGDVLYMDLDIVVLKNFDDEIKCMLSNTATMSCVSDAITWMGERFSSSLMLFKEKSQVGIFEKFANETTNLKDRPGGDQVWIGPQLSNIYFIDDEFPNLKKNLKFHIASIDGNKLTLPLEINDDIKLIDCSGKPKPHELGFIPYIKNNWHNID